MKDYHKPVLLQQVIDGLDIRSGSRYIDATLGGGGHTLEIIDRGGCVLGIDVDNDALQFVEEKVKSQNAKIKIGTDLVVAKGNFKDIDTLARANGFENVDGVLIDLGVSSFQLDKAEKGFSFLHDGPLDMRMDHTLTVTAADLVNGLGRGELIDIFVNFGEERNAKKIAQSIVIERQFKKILTTHDLVRVIEKGYGVTNEVLSDQRRAQISMRVFQALRIAVNDELGVIKAVIPKAMSLLKPGGRLAIISFHSLEDRIVKQAFVQLHTDGKGTIMTKKPLVATEEELRENRRSRSAKLRIFEKN